MDDLNPNPFSRNEILKMKVFELQRKCSLFTSIRARVIYGCHRLHALLTVGLVVSVLIRYLLEIIIIIPI